MMQQAMNPPCEWHFTGASVCRAWCVSLLLLVPIHALAQEESPPPAPADAAPTVQETPPPPTATWDKLLQEPPAPETPATPEPAPAPTPPPVPGFVPTPWPDAEEVALDLAEGSMELCDVITLPLGFVPQVGFFLELAADAGCLLPGAYGVDHVNAMHGERDGLVWQSFVGLAASKAWRDLTRWPVFVALGIGAVGLAVVATGIAVTMSLTVFPFAFLYLPVVYAGILAGAGFSYIVVRKIRKSVAAGIFHVVHRTFTDKFKDPQAQRAKQASMVTRPPFNLPARAWMLGAIAAGVDGDSSVAHLIPVVGPLVKAYHKDVKLKDVLRRVSKDELREGDRSFRGVDVAVTLTCVAEGVLGSLAHLGLFGGLAVFAAGTGYAAFNFQRNQKALPYALLAAGAGGAGMAAAGAGLLLLGGRELTRLVQPIVIPLAFGVFPDGPWFPRSEPIDLPVTAPRPATP
jgi:hypothetical protein